MKTISYNKLVRDKVPQIIERSGKSRICSILPDDKYIEALNNKLLEEVNEYLESGTVEELADIEEVLRAILTFKTSVLRNSKKYALKSWKRAAGLTKGYFLKKSQGNRAFFLIAWIYLSLFR